MWCQISIHTHIHSHILQPHLGCCTWERRRNKKKKPPWLSVDNWSSTKRGHGALLMNRNTFAEHQYPKNSFHSHEGERQKQDKSEIMSKHRQKNMVKNTKLIKYLSCLASLPNSVLALCQSTLCKKQEHWQFFLILFNLKQNHVP